MYNDPTTFRKPRNTLPCPSLGPSYFHRVPLISDFLLFPQFFPNLFFCPCETVPSRTARQFPNCCTSMPAGGMNKTCTCKQSHLFPQPANRPHPSPPRSKYTNYQTPHLPSSAHDTKRRVPCPGIHYSILRSTTPHGRLPVHLCSQSGHSLQAPGNTDTEN